MRWKDREFSTGFSWSGKERETREQRGGDFYYIPPHVKHGVVALEASGKGLLERIDYAKLKKTVHDSVRFLDDVIAGIRQYAVGRNAKKIASQACWVRGLV